MDLVQGRGGHSNDSDNEMKIYVQRRRVIMMPADSSLTTI